jgi:uncharacterized membrane protein YphA (DoxX/SURF4 family)
MLETIFSPFNDWGLLILRLGMGLIFWRLGSPSTCWWPSSSPSGAL